jgi:hypothetical protein
MSRKDISDYQVLLAYKACRSAINNHKNGIDIWPEQLLSEVMKQHVKVCYRAMERACDRGYIEYGVSLRSGWITEEGMKLLAEKWAEKVLEENIKGSGNIENPIGILRSK